MNSTIFPFRPAFRVCRITIRKISDTTLKVSTSIGGGHQRHKEVNSTAFKQEIARLRNAFHTYGENRNEHKNALECFAEKCRNAYSWFLNECIQPNANKLFKDFVEGENSKGDRRIEIDSDGLFYPVDMMYVAEPNVPFKLSKFVGLRMSVLKRVFGGDREYSSEPTVDGWKINANLRLAYAYDNNLLGHLNELDYFKKEEACGRLSKFHPIEKMNNAGDFLAIWRSDECFDLVHISSHMRTRKIEEEDVQELLFSEAEIVPANLAHHGELRFEKLPWLVFFNCCSSGAESQFSSSGFLSVMSYRFAHGFIATQADVEDTLASKFATTFYSIFFDTKHKRTLGESLMEAQRVIAGPKSRTNKMGDFSVLAYSLFNINPETYIEPDLSHEKTTQKVRKKGYNQRLKRRGSRNPRKR